MSYHSYPVPTDAPRPLYKWTPAPHVRRLMYLIQRGDPRPTSLHAQVTTHWWGPCQLTVEWIGKGEWSWRVRPRHFRSTGHSPEHGVAASAQEAKAAAIKAALSTLNDLPAEARDAMLAEGA